MKKMALRLIVLTATAIFGLAALSSADDSLTARISSVIEAAPFQHAHWGLLVADLESGETLYELNSNRLFAPASATKLYSVAAALDAFGPDYRFSTPVVARGEVDADGNLQGDLILVASGDLTLGGRTGPDGHIQFRDNDHIYAAGGDAELTPADPLAGLNELARQVVAASGIRRVRGDVLIDDRLFQSAQGTGSGPSRLTPIIVNDNLIDVLITPSTAGTRATVSLRPESTVWHVDAEIETTAADGPTQIEVQVVGDRHLAARGTIAAGRKPFVHVYEVPDAAAFARTLFIEALKRAGVAVEAPLAAENHAERLPPREGYSQFRQVAVFTSPPFSECVRLILKVSHNLHASTLPLLVAAKHGERTLAEGMRRQHDFLARAGVDVASISFGGGAGGHAADFVTPRATVQLLRYMATRPDFAAYRDGLPVLGIDGTLAQAVGPESPARGKAQAKTGTLFWTNVMNGSELLTSKALAGYLTTSRGRQLAFAMFVNNVHTQNSTDRARVGKTLGQLCEILFGAL